MNTTPGKAYTDYVADVVDRLGEDAGLRTAVGGDFNATGLLEAQLLKSLGLADGQFIIDVGCGSGRLAYQLSRRRDLRYLGTDVVPELLDYARRICGRDDWEFRRVETFAIPAPDSCADFVCFFSVFTHLLHEQSFRYLKEAARVLKPGGRIVFSFLEFRLNAHWEVFEDSVHATEQHLNQFIGRDAIGAWARKLGLVVDAMIDGDKPSIPLDEDVVWPDGTVMTGKGNLGQSIAVLSLPNGEPPLSANAAIPDEATGPRAGTPTPVNPAHSAIVSTSVRGFVDKADAVLIAGITVASAAEMLITASGHALLAHGIRDVLLTPHLLIYDSSGQVLNESRGWRHLTSRQLSDVRRAIKMLGAPELDPGGDDCAMVMNLTPGTYSVVVRSRTSQGGVVHLQVLPVPRG